MVWRRIASLVAVVVVAGCAAGPPTASPAQSALSPSAAPTDPVAAARRADLDQLLEELDKHHPNPFLDEGEPAFRARVEAVAATAGERTDAGFLVDVMRLMGNRDRDGHSGAWAMAQTGGRLHALPLWLREFPDGLRVVAARAPYEDLVGAIVTAVGGTPSTRRAGRSSRSSRPTTTRTGAPTCRCTCCSPRWSRSSDSSSRARRR